MANRDFVRRFEGKPILDELLELAGSAAATEEVLEIFKEASRAGEQPSEIIPTLFEAEPRFPDPDLARRLYQDLFGLWDLAASGARVELAEREPRPPREKKK